MKLDEIITNTHNTFGGYIYPSDFCTEHPSEISWASRIAADLRFDEQCKKNYETSKKDKKLKKEKVYA